MFEGKLGEKVFKQWLRTQNIRFIEDETSHEDADFFDFSVAEHTIDAKTFTQDFHKRLLEIVEQFDRKPKDYYIAIRLYFTEFSVYERNQVPVFDFSTVRRKSAKIVGWASRDDIANAPVENLGYGDNHSLWLTDLRDISTLAEELRKLAAI